MCLSLHLCTMLTSSCQGNNSSKGETSKFRVRAAIRMTLAAVRVTAVSYYHSIHMYPLDSESDKKKAHMKHRGGAPVGGGGVSAGTNLNALWQKKQ